MSFIFALTIISTTWSSCVVGLAAGTPTGRTTPRHQHIRLPPFPSFSFSFARTALGHAHVVQTNNVIGDNKRSRSSIAGIFGRRVLRGSDSSGEEAQQPSSIKPETTSTIVSASVAARRRSQTAEAAQVDSNICVTAAGLDPAKEVVVDPESGMTMSCQAISDHIRAEMGKKWNKPAGEISFEHIGCEEKFVEEDGQEGDTTFAGALAHVGKGCCGENFEGLRCVDHMPTVTGGPGSPHEPPTPRASYMCKETADFRPTAVLGVHYGGMSCDQVDQFGLQQSGKTSWEEVDCSEWWEKIEDEVG